MLKINENDYLCCPICHDNYVHLAMPKIEKRGDDDDRYFVPEEARKIELFFYCEWSHWWKMQFTHNKGITIVDVDVRDEPKLSVPSSQSKMRPVFIQNIDDLDQE